MTLFHEILCSALRKEEIVVSFPNLKMCEQEIVEQASYNALQKIKAIIEDDNLDDFACIEKIICVFEEIGSNGGSRHDFG